MPSNKKKLARFSTPAANPSASAATSGSHSVFRGLAVTNAATMAVGQPAVPFIPISSNSPSPGKPESARSPLSTAVVVGTAGLQALRDSSDALPQLKSVTSAVLALIDYYDQYVSNKEDALKVLQRAESILESLSRPLGKEETREIERRTALKNQLMRTFNKIESIKEQGRVLGYLASKDDAKKISGVIENLRNAIIDYQTSTQQSLYDDQLEIKDMAESSLLERLPRSRHASYRSGDRKGCLQGTRTQLLLDVENWAEDHTSKRVYWLNGKAGYGKTTISQTLAQRTFASGLLGASFFCSRNYVDRSSLNLIFPTIAFQLAHRFPEFRKSLVKIMKSDPDVGNDSLSNQLMKLIIRPLKDTNSHMVIIVDALDECKDDEPASALLSLLSQSIDDLPTVKFFMTGRPEPQIRAGFRLRSLRPHTEILLLHEVEDESIDQDIETFLRTGAEKDVAALVRKCSGLFIYADTTLKFLSSRHETPETLLQVILSAPELTSNEASKSVDPLYNQILTDSFSNVEKPRISTVHDQYRAIVGSIVSLFDPATRLTLASLIGISPATVSASLNTLHSVLLVPESDSEKIRTLHKSFPDYLTDPSRCEDQRFYINPGVHHAKVAIRCLELMKKRLKRNICDLPPYAMNDEVEDLESRRDLNIDEALEYACKYWGKHLELAVETEEEDVVTLLELLKDFAEMRFLWWLEVMSVTKDVHGGLLCILGAKKWISVSESSKSNGELTELFYDEERFILYFFDPISASAPHIYASCLVWCPKYSPIRSLYATQCPSDVTLVTGISASWDACIRTIEPGSRVKSLALSYKEDLIAVAIVYFRPARPAVKLFDASSGLRLPLSYSSDVPDDERGSWAGPLAFSRDDKLLLGSIAVHRFDEDGHKKDTSPTYERLRLNVWDVQTGGSVQLGEEFMKPMQHAAFSPDGTRVAAWTHKPERLSIWQVGSWKSTSESVIEELKSLKTNVCWIGNNRLVLGQSSAILVLWDVETHSCVKHLDRSEKGQLELGSITSSLDNSKFICSFTQHTEDRRAARTSTLEVYDCHLTLLHSFSPGNADYAIPHACFLPDETRILWGLDRSVCIWDLQLGQRVNELKVSGLLASVAHASKGEFAVIGSHSESDTVQIWKPAIAAAQEHTDRIHKILIAPNERFLLVFRKGIVMEVWDLSTGACVHTTDEHNAVTEGDDSPNHCPKAAFSLDSSLLVTGDKKGYIRIWNIGTDSFTLLRKFESRPDLDIEAIAISHGGTEIAVMGHSSSLKTRAFELWEVKAEMSLAFSKADPIRSFPWSPCRRYGVRLFFSMNGTSIYTVGLGEEDVLNISPNEGRTDLDSLPYHLILPSREDIDQLSQEMAKLPSNYALWGVEDWIMDSSERGSGRKILWIPPDKRSFGGFDISGQTAVINSENSVVIIHLP